MVQAKWNGKVIAESSSTKIVDGNHYFPADSINKEYFKPSSHTSVCGYKGTASYHTLSVDGKDNENACWYYPNPRPGFEHVAGYFAFWKGVQVA